MIELTWQGTAGDDGRGRVAVIAMDDGENRFDLDVVRNWHHLLDEVEATAGDGPLAIVTTGTGKFYSNGLNLDWMMANSDQSREFLNGLFAIWGRILGLDCLTVAAVNGHAFGAGALLTAAHDRIVMRADRGFWCMPELDLGLPVAEPMASLLLARLPRTSIVRALNTGHRFSGSDALAAGIADETAGEHEVLGAAIAWADERAPKSREVLGVHKRMLHGPTIDRLLRDRP